mmetsp:Transcript_77120/g.208231  ORF Transcript_77120/g.208231 Transcript_77120/m.208231 type:complete len:151 (+) Transcript_77120:34-486(+)|eukprot:CAMPEP_0113691746 /NCGR_PEP_ID=MMETSP0038_2-20120614/18653_1 /TAXON_ID=2898 /ORGANISM="Cryptomonas paramecium" /LENGTH=150 /DNA_ID=CAMNT_0000613487 /DNA_START=33 /DNA_END=485 /DNA_ORIENTATION=+ /assembly_acc=CAM_ASM_000170
MAHKTKATDMLFLDADDLSSPGTEQERHSSTIIAKSISPRRNTAAALRHAHHPHHDEGDHDGCNSQLDSFLRDDWGGFRRCPAGCCDLRETHSRQCRHVHINETPEIIQQPLNASCEDMSLAGPETVNADCSVYAAQVAAALAQGQDVWL